MNDDAAARVDRQRRRWLAYRTEQQLTKESQHFARGGLGAFVGGFDVRFLVLPADPRANFVPLDGGTLTWFKEDRPAPHEGRGPDWGDRDRTTSDALVLYDQSNDDGPWCSALALHRHGGVEALPRSLSWVEHGRERRVFSLKAVVAHFWSVLQLQLEASERFAVSGPYEATVALMDTKGTFLSDFAEGWRQPHAGLWSSLTCIEPHILLRYEVERIEPESMAIRLGDDLENAFGTTQRRHLARVGSYEGRFDPRLR